MRRSSVLAAALFGAPALAQPPASPLASPPIGAPADSSAPRPGAFFLSAGTDALSKDFGDPAPGLAAHFGYERRIGGAGSRFALRLAGDHWRTGRAFTGDLRDGRGPLDVQRTISLVGGSLLGVMRLPSLGDVRPYALAGVGVLQYSNRNETTWVPDGPNTASKVVYLPPLRVNTMAYTTGLGASMRLGPMTPFAEARLMVLPGLGGVAGQQVRAPLTFGLRF